MRGPRELREHIDCLHLYFARMLDFASCSFARVLDVDFNCSFARVLARVLNFDSCNCNCGVEDFENGDVS